MSRTRYRFGEDHFPHFMTDTIVAWLPVLSRPEFADIIFQSWKFLHAEREIDILGFVVMENHLHWIAVGPQLSKRVKEYKSFTATSILKLMAKLGYRSMLQELEYYKLRHKTKQSHQLWQEGSHPKMIESEQVMWQKLEYMHNNPLRRGYISDSIHWRYSSARCYAGQTGMVEVCTDWR